MPYNGSGTFSVVYTFVPNTTISSTDMNGQFTDIASGLTNCLTKDGQSIMTGQIKAANGTVLLPGITWGTDLDTGFYRIAANNIGFAAGGVKILDISSTGLVVTGALTPSTSFVAPAGTAAAPSYAFTGDSNSGFYWIGADNIGLSLGGTKRVDFSTTGVAITGTFSVSGASTLAGGALSGTFTGNPTFSGTPVFSGANLGTGTYSGNATFSGATTFNNAAGIAAKNTAIGFAYGDIAAGSLTQRDAFGGTITRESTGNFRFTFSSTLASAFYTAIPSAQQSAAARIATLTALSTGSVTFSVRNLDGDLADPDGVSITVFQD